MISESFLNLYYLVYCRFSFDVAIFYMFLYVVIFILLPLNFSAFSIKLQHKPSKSFQLAFLRTINLYIHLSMFAVPVCLFYFIPIVRDDDDDDKSIYWQIIFEK